MSAWAPTSEEVDAAERILSEVTGESPDGFWRATAIDILVEAHEAGVRAREGRICTTS